MPKRDPEISIERFPSGSRLCVRGGVAVLIVASSWLVALRMLLEAVR